MRPDPSKKYLVTGGEDNKIGQELLKGSEKPYDRLRKWTRKYPQRLA